MSAVEPGGDGSGAPVPVEPPGGGYRGPVPPGAGGTGIGADALGASAPGAHALASWWSRAAAAVVDGLVILGLSLAILAVFGAVLDIGFFGGEQGAVSLTVGILLAVLVIVAVSLLYAPVLMARTDGQTWGRKAVGIRVIRANGKRMGFAWATLREVVIKALVFGILSSLTFGLAGLLDVLWPLWDGENRALHDYAVDTRVVRA